MSSTAYYEEYWTKQGFFPAGYEKPELQWLFRKFISPGSYCLDVGCGDCGTSGPILIRHGCKYLGVDVSANAITCAQEAGFTASQIKDSGELPFGSESFDAVVCIEVLEHLFDPAATVREMLRVVRPGGVVVATVPNVAYWRRRMELLVGRWNPLGDSLSVPQPWRDPHIRFYTIAALRRMFSQSNFTSVEMGGIGGAILRDIPIIGRHLPQRAGGLIYRGFERLLPSLFGYGIFAVGKRPLS